MSERMIELQKAKLLGQKATANSAINNSTDGSSGNDQTPQQMAAATVFQEETKLKSFLQKISQTRNDNNDTSLNHGSVSHPQYHHHGGPTVPTALCRRILQKQGVGYLDDTVAAVTAAAADRFLATLLQQGATCRKRRCDGTMMNNLVEERRKHVSLYRADADDRKRRKLFLEQKRTKEWLAAVQAAKDITDRDATNSGKPTKKKKRPISAASNANNDATKMNGSNNNKDENEQDGLEEDSLDDEEEYYNEYYGELSSDDDDNVDESNFMLLLRDLKRPLEAWGFKLTGKIGLGAIPLETVKPKADEDDGGREENNNNNNNAMDDNEDEDEKMAAENGDAPAAPSRSKSPKPSSGGDDGVESIAVSRANTPMNLMNISPNKGK
mmetsp:Transcript_18412/g.27285  ORF Transcript_18412/g.27285 Transcript_18412/m.27285 type:complete len:383 (+) Transcript_18412:534-1682(+)|eukprot:CAMPEP_0194213512 /NCGR_PEP_ID=MMETSP0156-20130528/14168_1 /TAXON_ID=33649 /ORGANISM="Thalassionema nitzschioides, Strain L26-B" /LENGTH=382 /DNA_ID=CAMNT_0038941559 /DNA_START=460 /DNA_END=1608 /DNA_ORIENTATION=-